MTDANNGPGRSLWSRLRSLVTPDPGHELREKRKSLFRDGKLLMREIGDGVIRHALTAQRFENRHALRNWAGNRFRPALVEGADAQHSALRLELLLSSEGCHFGSFFLLLC